MQQHTTAVAVSGPSVRLQQQHQQQGLRAAAAHASDDAVMELSSEMEDNVVLAFRQLEAQMDSALGAISSTVPRALASPSPEVCYMFM